MALSKEEIRQIAKLARLELSDLEAQMYAEQLSSVLDYMEVLNEVNVEDIPETVQVTGLADAVRKDNIEASSSEKTQKLISQFPDRFGNLLRVKKVFDK